MSLTRLRVWHKCFKEGRTSFQDDKHTGCPCSARTPANIQSVSAAVQANRRKTVRQISEDTKISKTAVHTILKKDMNLSKVAPKMVPKLLTDEQKRFRVRLCEENLALVRAQPDLMRKVVIGDESWISVLEVETKQASCEWVRNYLHRNSFFPDKNRIFQDFPRILLIHCPVHHRTVMPVRDHSCRHEAFTTTRAIPQMKFQQFSSNSVICVIECLLNLSRYLGKEVNQLALCTCIQVQN